MAAAGIAVALAVGAVVAYRVFAPQEILMRPSVAYPEAVVVTDERPFSELRAAPLIVEGRLRVYAEKWRVWSDAPVGGRYEATPYWAYRRWPAQVVGVVTVTTTESPLVVSHWSDGQVVAIDARRGEIAWRAAGPDPRARYEGRRTGATTVYEPASLVTARTASGTALIVTGPGAIVALDAAEGVRRWDRSLPDDCRPEVVNRRRPRAPGRLRWGPVAHADRRGDRARPRSVADTCDRRDDRPRGSAGAGAV